MQVKTDNYIVNNPVLRTMFQHSVFFGYKSKFSFIRSRLKRYIDWLIRLALPQKKTLHTMKYTAHYIVLFICY
jgi:uncharacterized protein (DUF362 family)